MLFDTGSSELYVSFCEMVILSCEIMRFVMCMMCLFKYLGTQKYNICVLILMLVEVLLLVKQMLRFLLGIQMLHVLNCCCTFLRLYGELCKVLWWWSILCVCFIIEVMISLSFCRRSKTYMSRSIMIIQTVRASQSNARITLHSKRH